jgi:shikimate kinase
MNKHLFLVGFMGAGKSTIGLPLAQKLQCKFVDLDAQIVCRAGKSIAEIFAQDGETVFRDFESRLLEEISTGPVSVVATGGGVVGREANYDCMRRYGTIVYLQASWETLKTRIGSGAGRPLAGNTDNGWTRTHDLWLQRIPLYEQADLIIPTDGYSVHTVIESILVKLDYVDK